MRMSGDAPVQVGSLHIAKTLRLTATEQNHVRRDEVIRVQADNISDSYTSPWSLLELLTDKHL